MCNEHGPFTVNSLTLPSFPLARRNYASAQDKGFIRTLIVLRTLNSSFASNFTSVGVLLAGISTNITLKLSPVILAGNTTESVPNTGPLRSALKVMSVYSFSSRLPIEGGYTQISDLLRLSFGFGIVTLQPEGQGVGLGFFRSSKRCPPI